MNELYKAYLNYITKKADEVWNDFNNEIEQIKNLSLQKGSILLKVEELQVNAWSYALPKLQRLAMEADKRGCASDDIQRAIWIIR